MNVITKRTVVLVGALAAFAAWLTAAATSGVRPIKPVATARPQIDLRGAALTAEIERLHDRLRPRTAPDHGRNLFQFARPRSLAVAAPAPVDVVAAPAAPAPVEPPFKLIGIAEDNGTRTAILSSPSQLLLVHAGDNAGAYHVTGISSDAVELSPLPDGPILRLALK